MQHKSEVLAVLRPEPYAKCGSATGRRVASGEVCCVACCPKPKGAETVLLLTLAGGGTAWVDYAEELAAQRTRLARLHALNGDD